MHSALLAKLQVGEPHISQQTVCCTAQQSFANTASASAPRPNPMDQLTLPVVSLHTGCLLLAASLLGLLCRCVFRSLACPTINDDDEPPELYASSHPCTRAALDPNDRGQLLDAVRAMRTHAAEDQLLDAGALLLLLRRAIAAAPGSRAAAAATAALKEEVRPGMGAAELARRHAECDETLRLLSRDAAEGGGGDWQRLSQHGGTSTFVRRGADGMLWARATGEVGGNGAAPPVPLFRVLALFRHCELFSCWWPFCVESATLAAPGQCERLFRVVLHVAVPLFGAFEYDMLLHAYGADCLATAGSFIVCGRSARQRDWPNVAFPRRPPGGGRQEIAALRLRVTPLAGGRTHASLTYAIDPRRAPAAAALPSWVVNWLVSHAVGSVFTALAACARRMHDRPHASEHVDAIAAEPAFYQGWLAPRVAAAVAAAEDGQEPPPPAPLAPPTRHTSRSNMPEAEGIPVRKKLDKHPTLEGVFVRSRSYA